MGSVPYKPNGPEPFQGLNVYCVVEYDFCFQAPILTLHISSVTDYMTLLFCRVDCLFSLGFFFKYVSPFGTNISFTSALGWFLLY